MAFRSRHRLPVLAGLRGTLGWDPRREITGFGDLSRFPSFEDEWLRGGPVQRWIPKGFAGKPVFVFETGGTTGIPKTRVAFEDFRIDYELFSETLPDEYFPRGSNWLMLGPSGPRRLRLAVEHLAQYRGGICFCVDLDPRWVIKLIKKGWMEHLEAYKSHVIDQAVTILQAGHDIRCMFTTPKLLEALALRLESMGTTIRQAGITGIFSGGTEFTPQWNRFAHEELLDGAYMTPTYGNTLMGLAASAPTGPENNYKITLLRAAAESGHRGRGLRRSRQARRVRADRPCEADDADKGVLRARLPRARRGRAGTAVREISVGRRQRRSSVPRLRGHHHCGCVLMLNIPILRWGQPYASMDADEVVHFLTGEPIAKVSRANAGLIQRDMRKAANARDALRKIPIGDLIACMKTAGDLYMNAELPLGDGTQTPDDFVRQQSASTGLPEAMCRANMKKNQFVLCEMGNILKSLTRGLDLDVLTTGYGEENGVPISYQAQSPVLGLVLPSNSPGVHTLWLPIIPMQVGLVLKPGPQEPWTPYRMAEAFFKAGIPREAISMYPGEAEVGAAVVGVVRPKPDLRWNAHRRALQGKSRVQVHGPGFSKILFGDDRVDDWERYLDVMVDSVFLNSGRGCINCSGIWVSRHSREIADALAKRLAAVQALPPDRPERQPGRVHRAGHGRGDFAVD